MPGSSYPQLARTALRQTWRYRLRSALVMGCAALGVAGAITSANYAAAGRQRTLEQVQRLGTNLITVSARPSRSIAGRERTGSIVTTLRPADYEAIAREVEGLVRSSALTSASLRLKAGGLSKTATIVGCEPDYFAIRAWPLAEGERFEEMHERRAARVAILGATAARDLYGGDAVGSRLFINRVPFEVIGVLAERGQGADAVDEDQRVFVPLAAGMRRLMGVEHFNAILFEVRDWQEMDRVAADITAVLQARHRVAAQRAEDFQVQNQKDLLEARLAVTGRLDFLVRWIAFSALVVAGLGVLAIAWIAVRERTREIGTRRALGASAPEVFFQFALEAAVLAACGIAAGLALGWLGSWIAAREAGLPFVFAPANAALAAGAALLLNLVFAGWPALRAARLDPVVALRHE